MKKIRASFLVSFLAAFFAAGAGLSAQGVLFSTKAGTTLTYAQYDAKGATQGYSVLTIKDVKGTPKNMTITYTGGSLDKNRKKTYEQTFKVTVKDDVLTMDMNQLIPPEMKDMGMKMEVKGTGLELPSSLRAGQSLKPSSVTATADLGYGMKLNIVVKNEGKCVAIENVKVPAGTFKCHKITQKTTTTVRGTTNVVNTTTWYAPNVGTVKTETYDDRNKLKSSSALVEVKGK